MTSRTFPPRTYLPVLATFLVMLIAMPTMAAQGGLQAVATSPTSITLNWTAPGDDGTSGTAAQYDIRYSTVAITSTNWSSCVQVTNPPTPHVAGTKEAFDVTGLTPNTSYYFAIKASDEVGNWSGLSNVINKITPQETTAPAAITNLAAPTATATAVTLTWTAPGDDGSTGTAKTYDVRYATAAITDANWATATQATNEPAPKAAGSAESFTISGLTTGKTYYFAIKTADEVPNWSLLSNVPSKATSQETTPPSPIANLTPTTATASSVVLTWTAPGDDGTTGTATSYDLRYSIGPITDANWSSATQVANEPAPKVAGTAQTDTVAGLSASTTYYFAIKTVDDAANWSTLSNVPFKATASATETVPPAAIANLNVAGVTSTSVTLTWTAPGDDGNVGTATAYDLRRSTAPITASNFTLATYVTGLPVPKAAGSAETFTVTGLTTGTTYYFAITSRDEVPNYSAISNVVSGTPANESTPPQAIVNLAATASNDTSVTLSWTAPGDDSATGTAAIYDIRYSTSPISTTNWDSAAQVQNEPTPQAAGSPESFVIKGLRLGTTYYFAMKTADEVPNWSSISNVAARSTTGDKTPPAPVDDLSALPGNGNGQLVLHWTAPGDDGMAGKAVSYVLRYAKYEFDSADWSSATMYAHPPVPRTGGSPETFTMTGLAPGQVYWVGILSVDEAGNESAPSNISSAQTSMSIAAGDADHVPSIISPEPNAVMRTARPQLTVTNIAAESGLTYHFEVSADSQFSVVMAQSDVPEDPDGVTEWRPSTPLEASQLYYWRVQAGSNPFGPTAAFFVDAAAHPYPNPFPVAEVRTVTFTDLPEGADLVVLTVSGEQIRYWSDISGGDVEWDGTNASGSHVSAGTYLWYVPNSDVKGKLVVVR